MQVANFKQVVLVGGGHAHALFIRMWGMNPLSGVQLILLSPSWRTPYSGMLPGLLAGHYCEDDIHIDLRQLCRWANVRFIEDSALGLDLKRQRVMLRDRSYLEYDVVSLDIGSTPDTSVPGVKEFAQTIKPISQFYERYQALLQRCNDSESPLNIVVVGAGAGGVEVTLALAERLKQNVLGIKHSAGEIREVRATRETKANIQLILRDKILLPNYAVNVANAVQTALADYDVKLTCDFNVVALDKDCLRAEDGRTVTFDEVFFCTQARAADWLEASGLACDTQGFVCVDAKLQSVSHANVFAAGDIAAMVASPRSKAGVYAVRQAPFLFENIKNTLLNKPLMNFKPQVNFLSLLSLGDKKAVASRAHWALTHKYLQKVMWRWKDRIDRRFMLMLQNLPPVNMHAALPTDTALLSAEELLEPINPEMRCAGCGGKVGSEILQQVLHEVTGQTEFSPEDAAVVELRSRTLIQSVDQIKSPIDDPYLFARIATLHALSDVYAMNAAPSSVQLLVNLPYAGATQQRREMTELMRGILFELEAANCQLLGGHTAEASDLSVGLVVNAEPQETELSMKSGLRVGDLLVLTKPLGSGVILAAHMPSSPIQAAGNWVKAAINNMLKSNKMASDVFSNLGIKACTDVTGFGLIGHLSEMLRASNCAAEIYLSKIPLLKGALELSQQGVKSSLYRQNEKVVKALSIEHEVYDNERFSLLLDPQTSGGLLAGIAPEKLSQLQNSGIEHWVIGRVLDGAVELSAGLNWDLRVLEE